MQPYLSEEYLTVLQKLEKGDFDLSLGGPRMRPIAFGSRRCKNYEVNYHGFVRITCVDRVAIIKLHNCFETYFNIGWWTVMLLVRFWSILDQRISYGAGIRNYWLIVLDVSIGTQK